MKVPKLPAAVVTVLGVIATMLWLLKPSLPQPWQDIVTGVLGLTTLAGAYGTHQTVKAHGKASAAAAPTYVTRRPDSGGGGPRSHRAPAVVLAVLVLGSVSAAQGRPFPAPPVHGVQVQQSRTVATVPVVTGDSRMSCTGAVVHVQLDDVDAAGTVLRDRPATAADGLTLEGWFEEAWHPAASTPVGPGSFATSSPAGRWRAILPTSSNSGPLAWSVVSDPFLILAADGGCSGRDGEGA